MARHPTIQRTSDEAQSEETWLRRLEKAAVQPVQTKDNSIFEQITSIMNGKSSRSKHPSVQAAVDDMMNRSGMSAYLAQEKKGSEEKNESPKKIASSQEKNTPIVFKTCPNVEQTIKNYIQSTKGNISLPAILDRVKSIHKEDVSDPADWEDDNLIRWISKENLNEKSKHGNQNDHPHLGRTDEMSMEIDQGNTDAWSGLRPSKI
jgi:hypothetical protein